MLLNIIINKMNMNSQKSHQKCKINHSKVHTKPICHYKKVSNRNCRKITQKASKSQHKSLVLSQEKDQKEFDEARDDITMSRM